MFVIEEELKKLPGKPGVYIMHDSHDAIIYVGKAKVLKNRVRQYFQDPERLMPKIRKMVPQIAWFEYIVVDSEMEALVLECNLIKEHRPKYNTMLKDDKMYPYIKITQGEDFPRVFVTRRFAKDKARYFGPYTNAKACHDTMDMIRKLFLVRSCTHKLSAKETDRIRPCLYRHIGQCTAPCGGFITKEEYAAKIDEVIKFLSGGSTELVAGLTKEMMTASEALDFEKAAAIRDKINAINALAQDQKAADTRAGERDIIACYIENEKAVVQIFFMREGKLLGREHYLFNNLEDSRPEHVLSVFMKQYYSGAAKVPGELLLECEPDEKELLEEWLSDIRGMKVHILTPKRGTKERMVELAHENARIVFRTDMDKLVREKNRTELAVSQLCDLLGLDVLERMESYDISNISGYLNVGSMVVCENGRMKPNDYRRFRIKSVSGPDDYACMKEVLGRRFTHTLKEEEETGLSRFGRLPDLLLMDGGRGQVNVAIEVLDELGLEIPVCGMVKDDHHRTRGLYFNNVELPIDTHDECFKLLTRIQDETHRFAITYHRSLRGKEQVHSVLDDIKGVGPARRKLLMKYYAGLEEIKAASIEELAAIEGIPEEVAENIYKHFHE